MYFMRLQDVSDQTGHRLEVGNSLSHIRELFQKQSSDDECLHRGASGSRLSMHLLLSNAVEDSERGVGATWWDPVSPLKRWSLSASAVDMTK